METDSKPEINRLHEMHLQGEDLDGFEGDCVRLMLAGAKGKIEMTVDGSGDDGDILWDLSPSDIALLEKAGLVDGEVIHNAADRFSDTLSFDGDGCSGTIVIDFEEKTATCSVRYGMYVYEGDGDEDDDQDGWELSFTADGCESAFCTVDFGGDEDDG